MFPNFADREGYQHLTDGKLPICGIVRWTRSSTLSISTPMATPPCGGPESSQRLDSMLSQFSTSKSLFPSPFRSSVRPHETHSLKVILLGKRPSVVRPHLTTYRKGSPWCWVPISLQRRECVRAGGDGWVDTRTWTVHRCEGTSSW